VSHWLFLWRSRRFPSLSAVPKWQRNFGGCVCTSICDCERAEVPPKYQSPCQKYQQLLLRRTMAGWSTALSASRRRLLSIVFDFSPEQTRKSNFETTSTASAGLIALVTFPAWIGASHDINIDTRRVPSPTHFRGTSTRCRSARHSLSLHPPEELGLKA
jgi:hypothetical protein